MDASGPASHADEALRSQYLAEVLDLLYPGASADISGRIPQARSGAVVATYIVVPDVRRPRLLVPAVDRRVAAAAVRRYAEITSRSARWKRRAVEAALRTGADRLLLRDRISVTLPWQEEADSIDTYLARVVGDSLSVSVHIGPVRANRKPVLQVLSGNGDTVGFGKLGIGPLTCDLVRAETGALGRLGAAAANGKLGTLRVPRVLHAGQWHGHEVLIQSALPTWETRTTLSTKRLAAAMYEVATCDEVTSGALAAGAYWRTLRGRLDRIASAPSTGPRDDGSDPVAEGRALTLAADQLVATAGGTNLTYGAWHGDWAPGNMATTARSLLVWDWERFTVGVPLGFDALHFDFQRLRNRGVETPRAVETVLARADRLLAPFRVEPDAAEPTALLYLIDLAARHLEDRQAEPGARRGVLTRWLLPILTEKVSSQSASRSR